MLIARRGGSGGQAEDAKLKVQEQRAARKQPKPSDTIPLLAARLARWFSAAAACDAAIGRILKASHVHAHGATRLMIDITIIILIMVALHDRPRLATQNMHA